MVNLTFDALPGVMATGHIKYVDPLGVVSSGVVSYNVSISIDGNNDLIKTGMTAEASIVTDSKTGVLVVPNSAIKTSGNRQYVLVIDTSTSTMFNSSLSSSTRGFGRYGNSSATGTFAFSSSTEFSSSTGRQGTSSSSTRSFGSGTGGSLTLPSTTPVKQVFITTGVTDNTNTEVLSGLQGGELIVVRSTTVTTSTTKSAASAATSRTGGFGVGGAAGGIGRALGGGSVGVAGFAR